MILTFLLLVAATYRIARAVAVDDIIRPLRDRLVSSKRRGASKMWELVTCPHCVGWWTAGLLVAAVWHEQQLPLPLAWWPAVAGAQSWAASLTEH